VHPRSVGAPPPNVKSWLRAYYIIGPIYIICFSDDPRQPLQLGALGRLLPFASHSRSRPSYATDVAYSKWMQWHVSGDRNIRGDQCRPLANRGVIDL